mgnify:FL=1
MLEKNKHKIFGLLILLFFWSCSDTKDNHSPNIIIIYADDLGYGDLGCYGATMVSTPNIDKLAKEGKMFMDAHSPSAVCTPSRYSLLTGEYAWRINQWGPLRYDMPLIIDTTRFTLPKLLKQNGYATASIGKWHLGFGSDTTDWNKTLNPGPLEIGFDYYFGVPLVNSHAPFVYVENHQVVGLDKKDPFILRNHMGKDVYEHELPPSPVQKFPEKGGMERWAGAIKAHEFYRDEFIGTTLKNKSVEWVKDHVEKNGKEPFFLLLSTTNIHHPFTPHPRFNGTSKAGRYGNFIHELDWIVGELLSEIEKLKIEENTIVIFTSDNGGMLNLGGRDAWDAGHKINGNLLGFKFGAWEGGHRVPFIIRWPNQIKAGSQSNQLLSQIDLFATIAALLNTPISEKDAPDSFNMLRSILGDPKEPLRDHAIFAPAKKTHLTIRKGKWVYIGAQGSGGFGGLYGGPGAVAYTKQKNSDIADDGTFHFNAPKSQLYDLSADPYQTTNVVNNYPDIAEELSGLLEYYKSSNRSVERK